MDLLESRHWTVWGESRFRHPGISSSLQERGRLLSLSAKGGQGPGWPHVQGQLVLLGQNSVLLLGSPSIGTGSQEFCPAGSTDLDPLLQSVSTPSLPAPWGI